MTRVAPHRRRSRPFLLIALLSLVLTLAPGVAAAIAWGGSMRHAVSDLGTSCESMAAPADASSAVPSAAALCALDCALAAVTAVVPGGGAVSLVLAPVVVPLVPPTLPFDRSVPPPLPPPRRV